MRFAFLSVTTCLILFSSCHEDEVKVYPTKYSGTWEGTRSITQIGSCTVSPASEQIRLLLTVSQTGLVTCTEHVYSVSTSNWFTSDNTWDGKISDDGNIELHKSYEVNCNGVKEDHSITYTGKIVKSGVGYVVSFKGDETWCSDLNCVFTVSYNLSGPK